MDIRHFFAPAPPELPSYRVEFEMGQKLTARLMRDGKVVGQKKKCDDVFDYPMMTLYEWWWFDKSINLYVRVLLRKSANGRPPQSLVKVGEEKVREDDARLRQVEATAVFIV